MASVALKQQESGAEIPGEEQQQTIQRDYEAEARELGWLPKAEFMERNPNADPERCVDAKPYVERGESMMPLLKSQNAKLKRELDSFKKDVKRANAHFEGAEKRAYERAKADIEGRIEDATEVGDVAAVKAGLKELEGLKPDVPQSKYSRKEAQEAFDTFREGNSWYDKANLASASELEVNARLFADRVTEKNLDKTAELSPSEFFAMISELTNEKYPQLKKASARTKPASDVTGSTGGRGGGGAKSWDSLPDNARRTYQRFINKGIGITSTGDNDKDVAKAKAYYAKTHDWEGYKE